MSDFGRGLLGLWPLDPSLTYLNHGTVGAPPRRVLAAQRAIRREFHRRPAPVLLRQLADVGPVAMRERPRMRVAADAVAAFLGARGDDLVFVDNASAGVNSVLRSLRFEPGDEIVVTDHGYGAVANAVEFVASRTGARLVTATLPHPLWRADAITGAVLAAVGPRTKLVIVDHVTSPTALVLPVEGIVAGCHARGVPVLVDGAHAPGALALDILALGADWYTANLHKWAMSPISCGILWAPPAQQQGLQPLVVGWGWGRSFTASFDWQGTRDPSPWLAAPAGIEFMRGLGLEAMRAWNHGLAWGSARRLAERWKVELPQEESMVGTMVAVPLPEAFGATGDDAQRIKDALLFEDSIEVHLQAMHGRLLWRISAQVYNDEADVERATRAIEKRAEA